MSRSMFIRSCIRTCVMIAPTRRVLPVPLATSVTFEVVVLMMRVILYSVSVSVLRPTRGLKVDNGV